MVFAGFLLLRRAPRAQKGRPDTLRAKPLSDIPRLNSSAPAVSAPRGKESSITEEHKVRYVVAVLSEFEAVGLVQMS